MAPFFCHKLFYVLPFFLLCFLLYNNGGFVVEATHKIYPHYQNVEHRTVNHQSKPAYHFRPKYNWINDPNGPMYYKGLYHLFYQYNPYGSVWGNIVWAHSVSKDLINWIPLEHAIYPSKVFDQYGCWSGSATILPGDKPIILYTGIIDKENTQVQNYAVPANLSDPYLRKWIKPDNNPIIVAEPGVNASAFRDPTTAWYSNGHWRIGIGSRRKERGVTLLYRSRDFIHWIKAKHPLHSVPGTGNWECPDFFPVSKNGNSTEGLDASVTGKHVKHVHKVSLDTTRFEYYTIGKYYPEMRDKYVADKNSVEGWKGLRYDYGNFYASKSFFDPIKKRRILWGWANESDSSEDDAAKGWAGLQLIPRKVWLDPNGKQLLQWPIEELETLRGEKISICNEKLKKGEKIEVNGITAAQADVEVTFSFGSLEKAETFDPRWENLDAQDVCARRGSFVTGGVGPFGLATLASKNLEEYTPVFFRIFKQQGKTNKKYKVLMCSDATKSSLKDQGLYKPSFAGFVDVDLKDKKISLRTLIDHSIVESFGAKGKTCISSRVYPTLALRKRAHLYVFNNGTEHIKIENLDAWSLQNPLQMNTRTL